MIEVTLASWTQMNAASLAAHWRENRQKARAQVIRRDVEWEKRGGVGALQIRRACDAKHPKLPGHRLGLAQK